MLSHKSGTFNFFYIIVIRIRSLGVPAIKPSSVSTAWLLMQAGDRWRSATLSLDGVLDYDESDKDEVTFELSLFAESFQDMLMRDYGETVYEAMQSFR